MTIMSLEASLNLESNSRPTHIDYEQLMIKDIYNDDGCQSGVLSARYSRSLGPPRRPRFCMFARLMSLSLRSQIPVPSMSEESYFWRICDVIPTKTVGMRLQYKCWKRLLCQVHI